jgi:hypothetical protein
MTRRDRAGFVLPLVLVLVLLACCAIHARAALDAGATADVAGGQLALDARALALAAADERLLSFARCANDPACPQLFGSLRSADAGQALDPARPVATARSATTSRGST